MPHKYRIRPYATTGIGSLPHIDADEAANLCLEAFDIPFWPQLPRLSFMESMIAQYSEGMPSLKVDTERSTLWCERNEEEITRFYESTKEDAKIAISEDHAKGLYAFLNLIRGRRFDVLKGHITGPLTFSLGLSDAGGKAVYFDEELREICLMLLQAKARWQIDLLKRFATKVVIFIDEPIISALGGTTYMAVTRDETLRLLKETVNAIHSSGAISGIHCCGRAEWPLLMETGTDILNFDAYEYGDTLNIYPDETRKFLEDGGVLAWGVVPTTEDIGKESEKTLKKRFEDLMERLSGKIPRDLLAENIMFTPSCGTGSRSVGETIRIFQILIRLKEAFS